MKLKTDWKFRKSPGGAELGVLPQGTDLAISGQEVSAGNYKWAPSTIWIRSDGFVQATPPPPPPPSPPPVITPATRFKLGLNVLQDTTNQARGEAQRGCKSFLVMDSFGLASDLASDKSNMVLARRYWKPGQVPRSVQQVVDGLEGAHDGNLIYTITNEADQYGQGGVGMIERAKLEVAAAARIKEISGARTAVGCYSVGTPDFTNPAECDLIRALYAPAYNAGLIYFDMHLYAPNAAHFSKPDEWIWFTRRWEFLFTKCGFNPNIRHIVAGEGGMDEGNHGGFVARGMSNADFAINIDKYIAAENAPVVVNGVSYPSPVAAINLFQLSDPNWGSYSVNGYLEQLRTRYV